MDVPILTDVHEDTNISAVARVVDVMQTPAFLCRQTNFIHRVASAGIPVNLKKGQFLSPWEMKNVVDKAKSTGNNDILINDYTTGSAKVARKAEAAAPVAQNAGVRICLENHTEAFSDEVLWIINRVDHPCVGVCVDTNNSLMVGEDPLTAIRKLAPVSFTNHFSDHRIVFDQYGCRITGVAAGSGDVPMREAYQVIKANPNMKRLNIEVEFDPGADGREEARRREYQAVVDSIRYTREELGVSQ